MKFLLRSLLYAGIALLLISGCATAPTRSSSCIHVEELMKQAEAGDTQAQYRIGRLYNGSTPCLPDNQAKRIEWYQRAAEQGHGRAMVTLAEYYRYGRGVSENIDKSVALYLRAAAQGETSAMRMLEKWYVAAAERGDYTSRRKSREIIESVDDPEDRRRIMQFAAAYYEKIDREMEQREEEARKKVIIIRKRKEANLQKLGVIGVWMPVEARPKIKSDVRALAGGATGTPLDYVIFAAWLAHTVSLPLQELHYQTKEDVRKVKHQLDELLTDSATYERLRDRVLRTFQAMSATAKAVEESDSKTSYQRLHERGIDTLVHVTTINIILRAVEGTDRTALAMNTAIKYSRIHKDSAFQYERKVNYAGSALSLEEWAANDGKKLRIEIENGWQKMAETMVATLAELAPESR